MATAGKYSCEVSADAPSFHTLIAAAELEVVGMYNISKKKLKHTAALSYDVLLFTLPLPHVLLFNI